MAAHNTNWAKSSKARTTNSLDNPGVIIGAMLKPSCCRCLSGNNCQRFVLGSANEVDVVCHRTPTCSRSTWSNHELNVPKFAVCTSIKVSLPNHRWTTSFVVVINSMRPSPSSLAPFEVQQEQFCWNKWSEMTNDKEVTRERTRRCNLPSSQQTSITKVNYFCNNRSKSHLHCGTVLLYTYLFYVTATLHSLFIKLFCK